MSDATATTHFIGDGPKRFALPADRIVELERATGVGIGALSRRVFAGDFSFRDLRETVRIGLVGGGMPPEDAARLVALYVDGRPLQEAHPIAVAVLEAAWFGKAGDPA